jgi:hypothetical protein
MCSTKGTHTYNKGWFVSHSKLISSPLHSATNLLTQFHTRASPAAAPLNPDQLGKLLLLQLLRVHRRHRRHHRRSSLQGSKLLKPIACLSSHGLITTPQVNERQQRIENPTCLPGCFAEKRGDFYLF